MIQQPGEVAAIQLAMAFDKKEFLMSEPEIVGNNGKGRAWFAVQFKGIRSKDGGFRTNNVDVHVTIGYSEALADEGFRKVSTRRREIYIYI